MLPTREAMQLENQRFLVNNGVSTSRQSNNKVEGSELILPNNVSQPNLTSSANHLSVSHSSNIPSTAQSNNSVYNSFYGSSSFNSINNFEASLQWLTESRIPSNSLLSDKNLNCNSHSGPSHSCCVNRLGTVDNIGMCSPLSGDSFRSNREAVAYQTKPPALSVNVIDSVQNWFNLPPLSNQQFSSKFNDQNLSCSQMNFSLDQTSELKQNDICLQIPDAYFEQPLNSSNNGANKQMNSNMNDLNNKITDVNDMSSLKGHNGYQSNMITREWKQPLQTANYISSPTLFGSLSDSPDHYLYSMPQPVSTSSYCMMTDNVSNISGKLQQQTCGIQQNLDKHNTINNMRSLQCLEQINHSKNNNQLLMHHQSSLSNNDKSVYEKSMSLDRISENLKINRSSGIDMQQNCSHTMKNIGPTLSNQVNGKYDHENHYTARYVENPNSHDILSSNNEKLNNNSAIELNDDVTSGSDESNIIVEESDDTEENESVVSIDEIKKSFMSEEPVELRCLVCNIKSSIQTPATQFIHMNDSFPLTSASKTPVASKLIQILPKDLQHFLKLHNSFMCRRCLNLIETVEVLEVKLLSVKQTLSENFSKTVQYFLPATPVLEIENGKAKIIDKEIITCIEKSINIESSSNPNVTNNTNLPKDHIENNDTELQVETDDIYDKELDDNEEEEGKDEEEDSENDNLEIIENNKENGYEGKQCHICSKILTSKKNFERHLELHTKCFSFYCEYCGKGFNVKNVLEKHIRIHNGTKYQCEICGKTYSQRHRLDYHLKRHSGEFRLKCKECGKGFMEKASLDIHIRSHTKEMPFVCEVCGSKFVKESNLKCHLLTCRKEEIKCNLCSEKFYSKTHLKKHEIANHGAKPSSECHLCGKTFVNVKDLKPHMRSHSQDKPFECKICGKRYKSVGNLNHHSKIHDINKLLTCTFCGEGFQRKKTLEEHMNKHSHEREYGCTECGKSFLDHNSLQRHIKIHSDDLKTKVCPVCGKKFHRGLSEHMRTHTGIKPYVCHHCGQAFTVNCSLLRHIQAKHPNVLET